MSSLPCTPIHNTCIVFSFDYFLLYSSSCRRRHCPRRCFQQLSFSLSVMPSSIFEENSIYLAIAERCKMLLLLLPLCHAFFSYPFYSYVCLYYQQFRLLSSISFIVWQIRFSSPTGFFSLSIFLTVEKWLT